MQIAMPDARALGLAIKADPNYAYKDLHSAKVKTVRKSRWATIPFNSSCGDLFLLLAICFPAIDFHRGDRFPSGRPIVPAQIQRRSAFHQ